MRKIVLFSALALLLASCGVTRELSHNVNNHTTQVVLAKNNFKVVEHVKGEASNQYFLLIIGGGKRALVEKARAKMLQNANLVGSSRAVINETIESHWIFIGVGIQYTVTVSADVIEFNE